MFMNWVSQHGEEEELSPVSELVENAMGDGERHNGEKMARKGGVVN